MWKRASMAIVVAVVAVVDAGGDSVCPDVVNPAGRSQQPAATSPQGAQPTGTQPPPLRTCDTGRDPARDHHLHGGHGAVVRADGRSAAAEALVVQRVSRELRLQPGLHRRLELADHVRCRPRRQGGDLRRGPAVRRIDRDVRPIFFNAQATAASSTSTRWSGKGWSGNQFGDFWVGAKFNLSSQFASSRWRSAARHAQAADRQR